MITAPQKADLKGFTPSTVHSQSVPWSSIAYSEDQSNWIKLKWLEASLQLAGSDMGFKVKSKG